jgi:protein gp37
MSDLFHQDVPDEFIKKVFEMMNQANWHQYQVLTKRSERLAALNKQLNWSPHIWMGVSVESADFTFRIDYLRETDAFIKFLSIEPLLGPIPDLNLEEINWVIVGGESGNRARPLEETWVIDVRNQCLAAGVPFFFKQWGGRNKKRSGRLLEGQTWDEMPRIDIETLQQLKHLNV